MNHPIPPAHTRKHHPPERAGAVLHSFYAPEFLDFERSKTWYAVAAAVSLAVVALGLVTHGLTLVIAYLLAAAVYLLLHNEPARMLEVHVTEHGLQIGHEFVSYHDVKSFWLVHRPPHVADLKLRVKHRWYPVETVHLHVADSAQIRRLLAERVKEEPDGRETFVDVLIRAFKL